MSAGSGKRPAPTIEGTATEVTVDPPPDETASPAVDPAPDGTASPEPAVEAGAPDAEGSKPKRPKGPPPRTSPTELKSFVTHLAAGLLGGLIGVVGLALAWNMIPLGATNAPDLTPLESRLAKLESAPPPAGDAEALGALGALDARVKTLEERKVETPADVSELTSRVSRLEESLNVLAETAKDGGSVPDAAALDAKIGDIEQKLQGKIDGALAAQQASNATGLEALQNEVSALKAKLGALAEANLAGDSSDLAPQLTTLDQRIGKLEEAIPALSTAMDKSAASAKSGASAIAFANLREAVGAGRPFAAELAALRSLMPDPVDLGVLPSHADTGIPTVAELARNLAKTVETSAAPAPQQAPAETSFLDSMIASAKSAVSIRRVGGDVGSAEPGAVLARAETALNQEDLAAAIKEVEALPTPARDAYTGWLDDARARVSANATLNTLESAVLASFGAPEAKP
jgi:hypothetical protein